MTFSLAWMADRGTDIVDSFGGFVFLILAYFELANELVAKELDLN